MTDLDISKAEEEAIQRSMRLFLVDSRDKAMRRLQEHNEYVENGEEPPDRLVNEMSAAALNFHDHMAVHMYDGRGEVESDHSDGDIEVKYYHELEKRCIESDKPTAEDPELEASEFASWIIEMNEQFFELGFGRLVQ